MNRKRLFSILLTVAISFTVLLPATKAAAQVPSDVTQEAWYYNYVNFAISEGFMSGTSDDAFAPMAEVNRAMVFQVLFNMEEDPELPSENPFADTEDAWYYNSALWAYDQALTTGVADGVYGGADTISREEIAAVFWRYAATKGFEAEAADLSTFVDEDTFDPDLYEELASAVSAGIITGRDGNVLDPKTSVNRAELSVFLYNLCNVLTEGEIDLAIYAPAENTATDIPAGETDGVAAGEVADVHEKYGNITLSLTASDLYALGYELGDVLSLEIGENKMDAPFGTGYSDVNNDEVVIVAAKADADAQLTVAINMGNFASTYGVAQGDAVTIALQEKAGYLDEYEIRQLERSNDREDYASDAIFANFRNVTLGDIAPGVLYRSSSPINNEINRASYADKLAEEAGIQTAINLADTAADIQAHVEGDDFDSPYYYSLYEAGNVVTLGMGLEFTAPEFKEKLKDGLEFLIEHDGPYIIHCNEGKDRAGFVMALLESLMGATPEEIKADYLLSYINYYNVEEGSDRYHKIGDGNVLESLRNIAGLEAGADLAGVDLVQAAESYLLSIGLTEEQIETLETKLSTPIE